MFLQLKINVFYFNIFLSIPLKQGYILSIITTVFNVTWSLEIILICWFAAQEIFLIIINLENSGILHRRVIML